MKKVFLLIFVLSQVHAQTTGIDWKTQMEADEARRRLSNEMLRAAYSGKLNSADDVLKAFLAYNNNPAVIRSNLFQQQQQKLKNQRQMNNPSINIASHTPQGSHSIQSFPNGDQQFYSNPQDSFSSIQSFPSSYQQSPSNYESISSNVPSYVPNTNKAPSSVRPSVQYPGVKNSLNQPESFLKNIIRSGGLSFLFGR